MMERDGASRALPFAKGHGTGNDFVVVPDPDGELDPAAGRGRGAVRPPVRRRWRRSAARRAYARPCPRWPAWPTRPSGSWTTATPTAPWPRCAATGCGCTRATWSIRGSRPARRWPILTRAGRVVARVDDDAGRGRHAGAGGVRRQRGHRRRRRAAPAPWPPVATPTWSAWCRTPTDLDLTGPLRLDPAVFPAGANVEFVAPAPPTAYGCGWSSAASARRCRAAPAPAPWPPWCCATNSMLPAAAGPARSSSTCPGGRLTVTLAEDRCVLAGPAVIVATGTLALP